MLGDFAACLNAASAIMHPEGDVTMVDAGIATQVRICLFLFFLFLIWICASMVSTL